MSERTVVNGGVRVLIMRIWFNGYVQYRRRKYETDFTHSGAASPSLRLLRMTSTMLEPEVITKWVGGLKMIPIRKRQANLP